MAGSKVPEVPRDKVYPPSRRWHVSNASKRAALTSTLIAVVVIVLVLVIFSPLALRQFGSVRGVSWARLSNIGQTYGAASALLTGLALVGVVGSLVFQVRAIQVSRKQAIREQHAHLVEMALADPVYQRAWGGLHDTYGSTERYRQHGYVNLIVSFWQDSYKLGEYSESSIHDSFASLFRGEAGRDFWVDTRELRMRTARRQDKRFCEIAEEEYQKAIAGGPPAIEAEESPVRPSSERQARLHDSVIRNGTILLLGAMGGIALQSIMRHWKRLSYCNLTLLR